MNYEFMNNKKESLIASKSFKFVIEIIRITKFLPNTYEHVVIIKQIIRLLVPILKRRLHQILEKSLFIQ